MGKATKQPHETWESLLTRYFSSFLISAVSGMRVYRTYYFIEVCAPRSRLRTSSSMSALGLIKRRRRWTGDGLRGGGEVLLFLACSVGAVDVCSLFLR